MTKVSTEVIVDLRGLDQFQRAVDAEFRGSGGGPIRAAMKQWGARYRSFAQLRYKKFSRGGGDWKPLKRQRSRDIKAAKKKRAKGKAVKGAAILRNLNFMFAALNPELGVPGQLQENIRFGVAVGYGGPGKYPTGRASIADIAGFHQRGAGNLPVRKTIVKPDDRTVRLMAGDMQRALLKMGDDMVTK